MSVEFYRGLPESLTQGLLVGKLLVGGLGVRIISQYSMLCYVISCYSRYYYYTQYCVFSINNISITITILELLLLSLVL